MNIIRTVVNGDIAYRTTFLEKKVPDNPKAL